MALDLHIRIPENSARWRAVQQLAASEHITPEEAAERVFDDGVRAQLPEHRAGNIWGIGADDADVLDEIVASAMAERRNRFARQLNA
jgi:hypothetical protein